MVTPTTGTMMLRGLASGKSYAVDTYIADVSNSAVRFDSGSGASATSLQYWKVPEDCVLYDMSLATGPTVIFKLVLTSDGAVIPGINLRIANFLNTLAFRPTLAVGFKRGSNLGAIEQV